MSGRQRVVVSLVVALVLAVAFAADRIARPRPRSDATVALADRMPTAAPTRSLASTWFCAGGTAAPGGAADVTVVIANANPQPVTANVTIVGTEGDPVEVAVGVPARSRQGVHLGDAVGAAYAAATVDVPGGGVIVEREVTGPFGYSASPCASSGSQRWHVADGSTAREDTMLLALYNPFPEDSIVDLSFSTDQGRAVPSDFQGLVVHGGRLVVVNVGDHVRRRERVAATVATRSGRVVVDRIQLEGGPVKGLSVTLAAPSAGDEWWFPEGFVGEGVFERFAIYNPSSEEAVVSLELILEEEAAEPFDLTIPPRDRVDVSAHDEERIPKGVAHSAVVRSVNGVGVIAERSLAATPPSGRLGTAFSLGGRRAAARWITAVGAATDRVDEWITVVNPGRAPVQLSFTILAAGQPLAVEGLQDVEVPAGTRRAFRLTDHIKRDDVPLLVEAAGGEVVVERAIYRVGATGIALSPAVPMR